MKNYIKKGQKLPLYDVGPMIVFGMGAVTLKLTEEKWLLDLYGQDYADYRKRVNRCIPWPPRKA